MLFDAVPATSRAESRDRKRRPSLRPRPDVPHFSSDSGIVVFVEVGVQECAQILGVSDRRVRAMIESGLLPARRVGGRWLVDESAVPRSRRASRAMSERMAWALLEVLAGQIPDVAASERARLEEKAAALLRGRDAARLLRSWLPRRAELVRLSAAPSDLPELRADERFVVSGVSDPRSGMSAAGEAEGYVMRADLPSLTRDFLLSSAGHPNVWLHVSDRRLPAEVPPALIAADLADHDGPREDARVLDLLLGGRRS